MTFLEPFLHRYSCELCDGALHSFLSLSNTNTHTDIFIYIYKCYSLESTSHCQLQCIGSNIIHAPCLHFSRVGSFHLLRIALGVLPFRLGYLAGMKPDTAKSASAETVHRRTGTTEKLNSAEANKIRITTQKNETIHIFIVLCGVRSVCGIGTLAFGEWDYGKLYRMRQKASGTDIYLLLFLFIFFCCLYSVKNGKQI